MIAFSDLVLRDEDCHLQLFRYSLPSRLVYPCHFCGDKHWLSWIKHLMLRFAAALLPLPLDCWEQHPRSHHKVATARVWTGHQLYPILCPCQLGQDIPIYTMVYSCSTVQASSTSQFQGSAATGAHEVWPPLFPSCSGTQQDFWC